MHTTLYLCIFTLIQVNVHVIFIDVDSYPAIASHRQEMAP